MRETRVHVAGSRPITANFAIIHTEPHRVTLVDIRGQPLDADIVLTISDTPEGAALHELRGTGSVVLQPYHLPELAEGRIYYFNGWRLLNEIGSDALLVAHGTITLAKSVGPSGAPGFAAFVTPDGALITDASGAIYLEKKT